MDENEYRQKLESESYKQLMQGELQAESAKNVALKNTNMALNNAGLQGSAYGGTLANATSNAYLTALQSNFSDFNTNLTNEGLRNADTITNVLNERGDTQENYINALNGMGIKEVGEEGGKKTLDFSGYNGYLTEDAKNALLTNYTEAMNNFSKAQADQQAQESGFTNTGKTDNGLDVYTKGDYKLNSDIEFQIDGETYKMRVGNQGGNLHLVGKNGKEMSKTDVETMFANKQVGVPFIYENEKYGQKHAVILVKDENGKVRRLETKALSRTQLTRLARKLGYQGNYVQVRNYEGAKNYGLEKID